MRNALLLLLLLASQAGAQVTGPTKVAVGELVVLRSETDAQWITLDPVDLKYEQFENGRALAFSSGIKSSRIVVLCVSWESRRLDRHIVDVGKGPAPDPGPGPDPGPTPDPDPTPPAPGKLWVIVVEETADLSPWRGMVFNSEAFGAYMSAQGHRIRIIDDDVSTADGQAWIGRAAGKARPWLFLSDTNGKIRYSGECPQTVEGMISRIKKAGG